MTVIAVSLIPFARYVPQSDDYGICGKSGLGCPKALRPATIVDRNLRRLTIDKA